MRQKLPTWIRIWFALDIGLALLPQVHWAASGGAPIFGLPRAVAYLFGLAAFAAASTLAAYWFDPSRSTPGER